MQLHKNYCLSCLILLGSTLINSYSIQAAVLTVSNHPAGGSQYNTLESAYTAASNGDTLMLEGSNTPYFLNLSCYGDWYKPLVIIGHGFNPQKQMPRTSKITSTGSCHGSFQIGTNAGGSKFFGIEFQNSIQPASAAMQNISFYNCKFNASVNLGTSSSNILFKNCVFTPNSSNLNTNGISNLLLTNCIFNSYIEGSGNANSNMLVNHCLFLIPYYYSVGTPFNGVQNAIISNSIIMNANSMGGVSNSEWNNNIFRQTTVPTSNGNTGSNNLNYTDPLFVNYAVNNLYDATYDFHTLAGSPVINAANDSTDIGLHGGTSKFHESGEPLIVPVIRSMNINQSIIAPNSTINVHVNITKPNDQ